MQNVEEQKVKPENDKDDELREESENEEIKKDTEVARGNTDLLPTVER